LRPLLRFPRDSAAIYRLVAAKVDPMVELRYQ
jgi:hypothetical protein